MKRTFGIVLSALAHAAATAQLCEPTLVGEIPGPRWGVAVHERVLYTVDTETLSAFDVAHPAAPVLLGEIAIDGFDPSERTRSILVDGDTAFIDKKPGIRLVDISNPTSMQLLGTIEWAVDDMAIENGILYVMGIGETRIYDVSNPRLPVNLASLPASGGELAVEDGILVQWLGSNPDVLGIYDVSDPVAPKLRGSVPLRLGAYGHRHVALDSHIVSALHNGTPTINCIDFYTFTIVDVARPEAPLVLWQQDNYVTLCFYANVQASTRTVSIATELGLRIQDVSDPSAPVAFSSLPQLHHRDHVSDGHIVYWTPYYYAEQGVGIFDLSACAPCYADCDTSRGAGKLDIFDFLCFQDKFVASNRYACDCDTSTGYGVCDMLDFLCFHDAFVAGCP